jgi:CRISPR-associated endonuclease/helicase Cas3
MVGLINSNLSDRVRSSGLPIPSSLTKNYRPHALASQLILERNGVDISCAVVLGGHHGTPPRHSQFEKFRRHSEDTGFDSAEWIDVQDELFRYALALADLSAPPHVTLDMSTQVILSGLVIMADWLASDSAKFELIHDFKRLEPASIRAEEAWKVFKLPLPWIPRSAETSSDIYKNRFDHIKSLRPVQEKSVELISTCSAPGIIILEAPMGEGKTEAALAMAEVVAEKTGSGGCFFALPSMATSDGMFSRLKPWVDSIGEDSRRPQSVFLAHGKAHLNEDFTGINATNENVGTEGEDNVIVNDWMRGRKKGMLASFVAGTIDQLLFMALKMRHLALRHFALAGKVVIIDECHAYDAYMNRYLMQALKWLGAYKTPVIVLSATLPSETRKELVESYLWSEPERKESPYKGWMKERPESDAARPVDGEADWVSNQAYPLITYTDGKVVKQAAIEASARKLDVQISYMDDSRVADELKELLRDGGCAGVICDTVQRAQDTYEILKREFGEDCVELLHSRFASIDRTRKEKELRRLLGAEAMLENGIRPVKKIIASTQVIEQSLDLDFDVLITDIAPMDLIIQRIGRLHRHLRTGRPERLKSAKCFVTGVESKKEMLFAEAIEKIYPRYLLMNTLLLLPPCIILPTDISPLVQSAYDAKGVDIEKNIQRERVSAERDHNVKETNIDEDIAQQYMDAKINYEDEIHNKRGKAGAFQIGFPNGGSERTMVNWLNIERKDARDAKANEAEASVRDTEDRLEVIVLWRDKESRLRLFPWIEEYTEIGDYELSPYYTPAEHVAKRLASCTVSLPIYNDGQIGEAIDVLEKEGHVAWQKSPWLNGELFLILDENKRGRLVGYEMSYSCEKGLEMNRTGSK